MNDIRLPLPKSRRVLLKLGRVFRWVTSAPVDRAYVTDDHRKQIIDTIKACSETNTARPGMIQMARIFLGDEILQQEGLL